VTSTAYWPKTGSSSADVDFGRIPLPVLGRNVVRLARHEQGNVIAFLREENRILKTRLEGRRLRLDDTERRRLAELNEITKGSGMT